MPEQKDCHINRTAPVSVNHMAMAERSVTKFLFDEYEKYRETVYIMPTYWVVILLNVNNGEHTNVQKTENPHELLKTLPKTDNDKIWDIGLLVKIGTEEQADVFIKQLTGDVRQIRGIMSRTVMASLLAEKYNCECYGNFDHIFKIKGAEKLVTKKNIGLEEQASEYV